MRRLAGCAVGDGDSDDEKRCPWGPETGNKLKLLRVYGVSGNENRRGQGSGCQREGMQFWGSCVFPAANLEAF